MNQKRLTPFHSSIVTFFTLVLSLLVTVELVLVSLPDMNELIVKKFRLEESSLPDFWNMTFAAVGVIFLAIITPAYNRHVSHLDHRRKQMDEWASAVRSCAVDLHLCLIRLDNHESDFNLSDAQIARAQEKLARLQSEIPLVIPSQNYPVPSTNIDMVALEEANKEFLSNYRLQNDALHTRLRSIQEEAEAARTRLRLFLNFTPGHLAFDEFVGKCLAAHLDDSITIAERNKLKSQFITKARVLIGYEMERP